MAPRSHDGIEWPELRRVTKRAPNGQVESEHRMVPNGREGDEWSGGRRVIRKGKQPEESLVTGRAPSFSEAEGSWVDLHFSNYMRSLLEAHYHTPVFSLEHGGSS